MSEAGATRAGTATVLFTDLVASTQVRQALGDERADDLRRAHDRILREAITSHGGTEVKGTGDGLMVTFAAAAEAVRVPAAGQHQPRPHRQLPLKPCRPRDVPVGRPGVGQHGWHGGVDDVDDVTALGEREEPLGVRCADVDAAVRDVAVALFTDRPGCGVHERPAVGDAHVPVHLFVVTVG